VIALLGSKSVSLTSKNNVPFDKYLFKEKYSAKKLILKNLGAGPLGVLTMVIIAKNIWQKIDTKRYDLKRNVF